VGVSVKYVHGRTAVMTIYVDNVEKEKIPLHTIKTKQAMHALMVEKGFVMKSNAEAAVADSKDGRKSDSSSGGLLIAKNKKMKTERLLDREDQLGKIREDREARGHRSSPLPATPPYQMTFLVCGALGTSWILAMVYARRLRAKRKRRSKASAATIIAQAS
jgi:hypothetical protein